MRIYIIENGEKLYWAWALSSEGKRTKGFWSKYKEQFGCDTKFGFLEAIWLKYYLFLHGIRGKLEYEKR